MSKYELMNCVRQMVHNSFIIFILLKRQPLWTCVSFLESFSVIFLKMNESLYGQDSFHSDSKEFEGLFKLLGDRQLHH